jgi:hypothetical protein
MLLATQGLAMDKVKRNLTQTKEFYLVRRQPAARCDTQASQYKKQPLDWKRLKGMKAKWNVRIV